MIKITERFSKSLKIHKNKKGIEKVLAVKFIELERAIELSNQIIKGVYVNDDWEVKKLDATSPYGAYRIIVIFSKTSKRIIYDFYFKQDQTDISIDTKGKLGN